MSLAILICLAAVAAFFSMGIFGLMVAKRYAPPELPTPKGTPKLKPKSEPADPHELVWWQDLSENKFQKMYELHLANGEIWRGHVSYNRYPDGARATDVMHHQDWDCLRVYERRIEWREPAIMALHAHTMVGWEDAPDGAYVVEMLNGSKWKLQPDRPMNLRWRFHGSDDPQLVHEALVKVYESLDKHLTTIQGFKENEKAAKAALGARYGDGVIIRPACGSCGLTPVSIPGGICSSCRQQMGPGSHSNRCRVCGSSTDLIGGDICQRCARNVVTGAGP